MIRSMSYWLYDSQPLKDICDDIIANSPLISEAGVQDNDAVNVRASKVSWIAPDNEYGEELLNNLVPFINNANSEANWNFELNWCENFQYTVYEKNDKYDWHTDYVLQEENSADNRKLSFTLLLNDDFEGGEFELEAGAPSIEERHVTVEMKKGDILFFPSYTWHRVKPVTKGTRKSLVGWIHGPNWQ
jgi:PKHD-type hydroxylase